MTVSTEIVNFLIARLNDLFRSFNKPKDHINCMEKKDIAALDLWSIVVKLRKSEKMSNLLRNGEDWTVYNNPDQDLVEIKDRLFFIDPFKKSKEITETEDQISELMKDVKRFLEIKAEITRIQNQIAHSSAADKVNLEKKIRDLQKEIVLFELEDKSILFIELNKNLEALYVEESEHYEKKPTINSRLITYEEFASEMSKTFKKYDITTCKQRAHFIAQTYHETQRYGITYEKNPSNEYKGGKNNYFGRGLIHLTHDYNYLEYYASNDPTKKKYHDEYMQDRSGTNQGVTEFVKNNPKSNLLDDTVLEELLEFSKTISRSIKPSCDAAGWFWKKNNINKTVNDHDDANKVSQIINSNEKIEFLKLRADYTATVKSLFDFSACSECQK